MSCSLCAICHYCISGVRSPETYERVVDAIFELPAPPLPFQDSTPGAALPWEVSASRAYCMFVTAEIHASVLLLVLLERQAYAAAGFYSIHA